MNASVWIEVDTPSEAAGPDIMIETMLVRKLLSGAPLKNFDDASSYANLGFNKLTDNPTKCI
jgi:hypothetical protein